jgi:hypothetical protein
VKDGRAVAKGVNLSQNKLIESDYMNVFNEGKCLAHNIKSENADKAVLKGANTNLQMHDSVMSKVKVSKNLITAAYTKYKVTEDFSTCIPLFLE